MREWAEKWMPYVNALLIGAAVGIIVGAYGRDLAWLDWRKDKLVYPKPSAECRCKPCTCWPACKCVKPEPVVVDCDDCQGDGKVEGQPCDMCGQTGDFTDSKGTVHKGKCPLCLGTGKRMGVCPICGGSGKLIQER